MLLSEKSAAIEWRAGGRKRAALVLIALLLTVLPTPALAAHAGASRPEPVPFRTLFTQPLWTYPCARPCYEVITTRKRLAQFWRDAASPLPTIDFAHNAVVAASWGELSDSVRFAIAVTRVVRVNGVLQVHVRRSFPLHAAVIGPMGMTTLVEVPRPFTGVQFIVQTDTYHCDLDLSTICQVTGGDTASLGPPNLQCRKHPSYIIYVSCYAPRKVVLAQSLIQLHPKDPSAAVARMTHLALHRIIDSDWEQDGQGPMRPHLITYLYGTQPASLSAINRTRRHPTFVNVLEGPPFGFSYDAPKEAIVAQYLVHVGAINDPNATQTIVPGPWKFEARIPKTNLWIMVVADGSRSSVHSLGLRILRVLG